MPVLVTPQATRTRRRVRRVAHQSWAWVPGVDRVAAAHLVGRPILALGLPRTGSSWVGATLADAPGVAYLREPITQAAIARHPAVRSPFDVHWAAEVDPFHRRVAEAAFAGRPSFPGHVVPRPEQWRLGRRRRLVVKEVLPGAVDWLVARFDPVLVPLVRHPIAVARSWVRHGWLRGGGHGIDATELAALGLDDDPLTRLGVLQARAERRLVAAAGPVPPIRHEDLAADPVAGFERLFDQLGLDFTPEVVTHVSRRAATAPATAGVVPRMREGSVATGRVVAGYLAGGGRLYGDVI